jgi:hypothetical protein
MIKTQIQLPDELYRELKRLAEAKEWSLAETLRRAAEQFLARHPHPMPRRVGWSPPRSSDVGWRGLDHEQIRNAVFEDMEPELESDAS